MDPDAPEKTGAARFFEIIQLECGDLFKLNLLFVISCIPVVTIPLALFSLNRVVRAMVLDQPVDCFYHYKQAFLGHWRRAYPAFALVAVPLAGAGWGAAFYLRYAGRNPLLFLPFMLCSTVFLVALLASTYFYGLLADGKGVGQAARTALALGVGRPARAVLAVVSCYGLLAASVLALPLSGLYLLLIGFSLPCLLGQFFVRTTLKQYCG